MSKIKNVLAKAISLASEQPMSYNEAIELLNDIDTCEVKIWLEEGAILPKYAHKEDACMDLGGRIIYHTGVHVVLPEDYEMVIRPRSSSTKTKAIIQNSPGTVDEGYRGEIMVVCIDRYGDPSYSKGDRVAHEVESLEDLGTADRGSNGFGSTGK